MKCYKCGKDIGATIGLCPACNALHSMKDYQAGIEAELPGLGVLDKLAIDLASWKGAAAILAITGVCLLYMYGFSILPDRRYPPGILVAEDPEQTSSAGVQEWDYGGFHFRPRAKYKIKGRVLEFGHFLMYGTVHGISPVDLTLGWGLMSDQKLVDEISFTHAPRLVFLSFRNGKPPVAEKVIKTHLSNNHLIPATREVRSTLLSLGRGDIVELEGYLVDITGGEDNSGFSWSTSLTRDDWEGGCEVFWVEKARTFDPATVTPLPDPAAPAD